MFENFLNSLKRKKTDSVFNPWYDVDVENDIDKNSPKKRLENLKKYLQERQNAQHLILAEALGYQGGHFSGIPMTSERIILGYKSDIGVLPTHVCNFPLERTSKIEVMEKGFNEPTATIVWQKLLDQKIDSSDFVLWNSFPWHPYKTSKGILSNRTPTEKEIDEGIIVLKELLKIIQFKKIIALGNKAHGTLTKMGFENILKVRHPANGGAVKFREQIGKLIKI